MMHRSPRPRGLLGIAEQQIRRAMGRDDAGLEWHLELGQPARGLLQDLPVGVTAHHDAHDRLSHAVPRWRTAGIKVSPGGGASARPVSGVTYRAGAP